MVWWGNGPSDPSTPLRTGFGRPQGMFGGSEGGGSWGQTPWQQQKMATQTAMPMQHLAGWKSGRTSRSNGSLFQRPSQGRDGQPQTSGGMRGFAGMNPQFGQQGADSQAWVAARDGNAATQEEWAARQGNPRMALFSQRHPSWQPQPRTSGGSRPDGGFAQPTERYEQEVAPVNSHRGMNQQMMGRAPGPVQQTQQWLNAINRESSPMSAKQNSLFTTPTSYGNSSAEDWLRTYG